MHFKEFKLVKNRILLLKQQSHPLLERDKAELIQNYLLRTLSLMAQASADQFAKIIWRHAVNSFKSHQ